MEPRGFGPRRTVGAAGLGTSEQSIKKGKLGRTREPVASSSMTAGLNELRHLDGPTRAPRKTALRTAFLAFMAAALVIAACSPTPPSPGPSLTPSQPLDDAAIYRQIAAQVSEIRGLDSPDRVEPTVIDRETVTKDLLEEFDTDNPPEQIAVTERIYKALGLLKPDDSLRDLYLELQGSQVIGYYDPTKKELFIVSHDGGLGPTERLTYAHEFVHELQDLHFDLNGLGLEQLVGDSDRRLARLSLVEGDATSAQTAWMIANLTPEELGQVAAEASDPALLEILTRMPSILLETSLFPYQAGATFVAGLKSDSGYAPVDAAYRRLPASTEQIIHPDAYQNAEMPIPVSVPANLPERLGTGWSIVAQDTLGELEIRVWLRAGGEAGDVARVAAEGWGGDRLALIDGLGGASILVWITAWDTGADSGEFEAAARNAIAGLGLDAVVAASATRVVLAVRSGGSGVGADLQAIMDELARG